MSRGRLRQPVVKAINLTGANNDASFEFSQERSQPSFRVRAPERELEGDCRELKSISFAIETSLMGARKERDGLSRRIEAITAQAGFLTGTGIDEQLDRDSLDTDELRQLEQSLTTGQSRIRCLDSKLVHLKFLQAALLTRFPQLKADVR